MEEYRKNPVIIVMGRRIKTEVYQLFDGLTIGCEPSQYAVIRIGPYHGGERTHVSRCQGSFRYDYLDKHRWYFQVNDRCVHGIYYYGEGVDNAKHYKEGEEVFLKNGDHLRIEDTERSSDGTMPEEPSEDSVDILFSEEIPEYTKWKGDSMGERNDYSLEGDAKIEIKNGRAVLSCFPGYVEHLGVRVEKRAKYGLAVYDIIKKDNSIWIYTGDKIWKAVASCDDNTENSLEIAMNAVNGKAGILKRKTIINNEGHIKNIAINKGDFVLLLGESGAGKSSFIKSIMGQEKSYELSGTRKVYGNPIKKGGALHECGYVPQFATLRECDTVEGTVRDAAKVSQRSDWKRHYDAAIHDLGLEGLEGQLISKLSGGQRKRVEMAVRYVDGESIFFVDEADSGLDSVSRRELMENLYKFVSDEANGGRNKKIVVAITHSANDAADLFTKVIVLRKEEIKDGKRKDSYGYIDFFGTVGRALERYNVRSLQEILETFK